MNINDQADVYADFQGLNRLRAAAGKNNPQALEKAAEQFEAIFLQTLLKSMRKASLGDGMLDNDQSRFYQEMFDQQIAVDLAKRKQVGIAEMLIQQLGGGEQDKEEMRGVALNQGRLADRRYRAAEVAARAPGLAREETVKGFESPRDFVVKLWPGAKAAAAKLGVEPEVLVAQAALETGWGQAMVKLPNGGNSNNLFNIKADHRWDGPRAVKATLEYEKDIPVMQKAAFRAYPSFQASFDDYVAFIKDSPRYSAALKPGAEGGGFIKALHRAGYATDPQYPNKINRILGDREFSDVVAELKDSVGKPLI